MQPKVSIIVPVYKAEQYLHRCVDSILAQTFTDLELLLIDDGSPDRSGEICDEYAKLDSRIRVFHKPNGGVSSARQCGIDNALGEYTIHVDPDDWVDSAMLEELYNKAKADDADMVICDFYEIYKDMQVRNIQRPQNFKNENILRQVLDASIHGSLCNKLIRRRCYSLYNISLPHEMSLWEDRYIICRLLMHNIKVSYLDQAFYYYDRYSNQNSIVRMPSLSSLDSVIYFIDYFEKHLNVSNYIDEFYLLKEYAKNMAFLCTSCSYSQFENLYKEINKRYVKFHNPLHFPFYSVMSLLLRNKKIPYHLYRMLQRLKH